MEDTKELITTDDIRSKPFVIIMSMKLPGSMRMQENPVSQ